MHLDYLLDILKSRLFHLKTPEQKNSLLDELRGEYILWRKILKRNDKEIQQTKFLTDIVALGHIYSHFSSTIYGFEQGPIGAGFMSGSLISLDDVPPSTISSSFPVLLLRKLPE